MTNPGQQSITQNSVVSLQINASATGGTLGYTASGLPTGLSINAGTGLISGTVTATPGTYRSTILVSAAGQVTSVSFNWIVLLPNLGSGQIMREYWTDLPGTTVATLTGNTVFPANPNGRDLLPSFAAPTNWDDNTGQRLRGFLYVPVTGQYQFFISSDDESSLKLSTGANPANAVYFNDLGSMLRDQGRQAEAVECYRQSLVRDPRRAVHLHLLGGDLRRRRSGV